jgi:N-acetylmuramoyl-L-alanine amidase
LLQIPVKCRKNCIGSGELPNKKLKMIKRILPGALFLSAVLVFSGCTERTVHFETEHRSTYTMMQDLVSVDLLASRLGLEVDSINSTHITLKNTANTVMIFTHGGAQFFVNGKEIGPVGQIEYTGGKYYVPESLAGQIRPLLRTTPTYSLSNPFSRRLSGTVVIDPGHGGDDPGAISVKGFYEKTVNLSVARKVAARLKACGLRVIMTRNSDRFVELERRAEIANQYGADLFVSIHADSSLTRTYKGYSVYVARQASFASQKVARAIARNLHRVSPDGNGIKRADYRVLVKTQMPAVLVEMGYISNHSEASLIATDSFQNRISEAISAGICETIEGI